MTDAHCRVTRIRMKAGGAEVRVIDGGRRSDLPATLVRHAGELAACFPNDMAGYLIIAWDFLGAFNRGTRLHAESPFSYRFLPGFVSEALRRDVVKDDVLKFLGVDPDPGA